MNLYKIVARTASIALAISWYLYGVRYSPLEERISPINILSKMPYMVCYCIGLWLATTTWSSRHRILALILLVPTLTVLPVTAGYYYDDFAYATLIIGLWASWSVIRTKRGQNEIAA